MVFIERIRTANSMKPLAAVNTITTFKPACYEII